MPLHEVTAYLAKYHLCHLWVPPKYIHGSDTSFSRINSRGNFRNYKMIVTLILNLYPDEFH